MSSTLPIISFGGVATPTAAALPPYPTTQLDPAGDEEDSNRLSLLKVAKAVMKAKRVAVVCGAGISCASGIPDFRSSAGLFESLKKQHPEARLSSGKDLFDASLFSSEQNAAIFYTMIAELKTMADKAKPTAFHSFLKTLDDEGKLFRVYTQNIDGLEEKAGLSYGLGDKSLPLPPRRVSRSPTKQPSSSQPTASSSTAPSKRSTKTSITASLSLPYPSPAPSPPRDLTPPPTHSTIPRCIPLHGHLGTMSCAHCSTTLPLTPYLSDLSAGQSTPCPRCTLIDDARASLGERSRGVGKLRPDVVLYGEEHKDGERVGEITRRDLMGVRPDLLLVVGTSLKVPGTKRLVRELAKVIKPTWVGGEEGDEEEDDEEGDEMPSSSATSAGKKGGASKAKSPPVHVVYLNYEFPTPSREWQGVFDVWMRGDVQGFVGEVEGLKRREREGVQKREREKVEKGRRKVEKEREKAAAIKGKMSAGAATKKVQATVAAKGKSSKAMVPNGSGASGKTKTLGGAAKPRATMAKATPPPPRPRAASKKASSIPLSRSSSASSSTSTISTRSSTPTSTRTTANSRSAAFTCIPGATAPGVRRTQQQPFTLTFAVTKSSVGSVTGTRGRKA